MAVPRSPARPGAGAVIKAATAPVKGAVTATAVAPAVTARQEGLSAAVTAEEGARQGRRADAVLTREPGAVNEATATVASGLATVNPRRRRKTGNEGKDQKEECKTGTSRDGKLCRGNLKEQRIKWKWAEPSQEMAQRCCETKSTREPEAVQSSPDHRDDRCDSRPLCDPDDPVDQDKKPEEVLEKVLPKKPRAEPEKQKFDVEVRRDRVKKDVDARSKVREGFA